MTQDNGDDDPEAEAEPYEVGYGKPPKATRFKPGKSGNPGGRPKGSGKSRITDVVVEKMKALVLEEAYRPIQIRDGDQLVELPVMQAVLRSLALNAAKGQQRAQRMLIDLLGAVEGERRKDREKLFEAVVELQATLRGRDRARAPAGVPEPSPLPHPDNLIVDPFVRFGYLARALDAGGKGGMGQVGADEAPAAGGAWRTDGKARADPDRRRLAAPDCRPPQRHRAHRCGAEFRAGDRSRVSVTRRVGTAARAFHALLHRAGTRPLQTPAVTVAIEASMAPSIGSEGLRTPRWLGLLRTGSGPPQFNHPPRLGGPDCRDQ